MTTIKTPLPEKIQGEIVKMGDLEGIQMSAEASRVNQLIDYLAELTEVVEGTLPARSLEGTEELVDGQMFTLKETLLGEIKKIKPTLYNGANVHTDLETLTHYNTLCEVEVIINRLLS